MSDRMIDVRRLHVPGAVLCETWLALRRYGRQGCEGFVVWLGSIEGEDAHVKQALVPEQRSIRDESGVGYFVDADSLFQLNVQLARTGLRLIAQVHSHPTDAYHSRTDDEFAIVTAEGGFSIVVPDFADGEPSPSSCAIYRLRRAGWHQLGDDDVRETCLWEPTKC